MVFKSIHALLKFNNITTNALYYNIKSLQLDHWDPDIFRLFGVGHP